MMFDVKKCVEIGLKFGYFKENVDKNRVFLMMFKRF